MGFRDLQGLGYDVPLPPFPQPQPPHGFPGPPLGAHQEPINYPAPMTVPTGRSGHGEGRALPRGVTQGGSRGLKRPREGGGGSGSYVPECININKRITVSRTPQVTPFHSPVIAVYL